jgi:hypothetical protein
MVVDVSIFLQTTTNYDIRLTYVFDGAKRASVSGYR